MEVIDNSRELKGFENIEEDIKLVGYFKSHKSERKTLYCDGMITCFNLSFFTVAFQHNCSWLQLQIDLILKGFKSHNNDECNKSTLLDISWRSWSTETTCLSNFRFRCVRRCCWRVPSSHQVLCHIQSQGESYRLLSYSDTFLPQANNKLCLS